MKRNSVPDIKEKIFFQNYENLFNVYETSDGDYYYNILRTINLPDDMGTSYYDMYTVVPGDTWTLLSHVYYGDVKLWWVICIANRIANPLLLPVPGTKLRILTPNVVQQILTKIRSS